MKILLGFLSFAKERKLKIEENELGKKKRREVFIGLEIAWSLSQPLRDKKNILDFQPGGYIRAIVFSFPFFTLFYFLL